jgi:hypothetical protein
LTPIGDLLLISKLPVPRLAKTRLAEEIGFESAAAVAAALLGDLLESFGSVGEARFLCGDQPQPEAYSRVLASFDPADLGLLDEYGWGYREQGSGDLGARLRRCCHYSFQQGSDAVALVGADAPRYDSEQIHQALRHARQGVATLGPCGDGGFGLLALPVIPEVDLKELFPPDGWGSSGVATRTCQLLERIGLPSLSLPILDDVDRGEDLRQLVADFNREPLLAARRQRTVRQLRILQKEGWSGTPEMPIMKAGEECPDRLPGFRQERD